MKINRSFLVFLLFFLLLVLSLKYHLPKQFVWVPTFSHTDKQPLGCALFDSLLSVSLPHGYALTRKTFYQLEKDSASRRGVLVVAGLLEGSKADVEALLRMAGRGDKVMLVSTNFPQLLEDTLHFYCTYSHFTSATFQNYLVQTYFQRDTLRWIKDDCYASHSYQVYPPFLYSCLRRKVSRNSRNSRKDSCTICKDSFSCSKDSLSCGKDSLSCGKDSLQMRPLAVKTSTGDVLAMACPWGKGEIILVSTPLLFTNYGVTDGHTVHYLFRLLSQMGDLPVVRSEGYTRDTAQKQLSPFRYLLSHPPLRWALYLSMLTIVLFMCFTARRRQRAIPVVEAPKNRSLEFIELIGTLYFQRGNRADLVRKKYQYLAEEVRKEMYMDAEQLEAGMNGEGRKTEVMEKMACRTGWSVDELAAFWRELCPVVQGSREVDAAEMKRLIDKMNELARLL